jgi:7,8-dihydropterin-6-yl-methyl-4-(beta-D-ribofuranosyl)aminobenzene 5'-phosphate synthase
MRETRPSRSTTRATSTPCSRAGVAVLLVSALACASPQEAPPPQSAPAAAPAEQPAGLPDVSVTILTTNAADVVGPGAPTQGEWSFAAWVEVGDRAFLFDTGWSPDNVLYNAATLGIDLSAAEDLVLSHHHGDHTGGVERLRTELAKSNPQALSRIHVAAGIFASRPTPDGGEGNPMVAMRERVEATGATFVVHDQPAEIAPGVWVTGPVARPHEEKNYPSGPDRVVVENGERVPDVVPESQSLVVLAQGGPVLVTGCGHAGLVNTLEHAKTRISADPPQAAIGGFHLFGASDEVLQWTADKLEEMQLGNLLGSHCTGFEAVYRIRELAGMRRETARIGAVGTRFVAGQGIFAGSINR